MPKRLRYFVQRDGAVLGTAPHEPVGLPAKVDETVNAMGVATVGAPSQPEPAQPALPKSQAHDLWAVLIARICEVFPRVCPISASVGEARQQRFCQRCWAGLRLSLPKNAQTEKSRATGPEQAFRQTQPEGL